jgi:hypothetical protein
MINSLGKTAVMVAVSTLIAAWICSIFGTTMVATAYTLMALGLASHHAITGGGIAAFSALAIMLIIGRHLDASTTENQQSAAATRQPGFSLPADVGQRPGADLDWAAFRSKLSPAERDALDALHRHHDFTKGGPHHAQHIDARLYPDLTRHPRG